MTGDGAPDWDPGGVAGGAARAARRREGAHAAGRRALAPGAALGTNREGVRLRDGQRDWVYKFHGGKIVRMDFYLDQEKAVEAAGLPESGEQEAGVGD